MSFLSDDIGVDYPKTVTVSHAEIERLEKLLVEADKQLDAKDDEIGKLSDKIDDFEDADIELDDCATEAINAFLDECERVGPLRFDVPQSDRANRAIIRLHNAVGRNP